MQGTWSDVPALQERLDLRRDIDPADEARDTVLISPQHRELGLADVGGMLQHALEHRREIAGRAGDDPQHLRHRGLPLERIAQIVGALAHLLEQPRVLDRDLGLVGEARDQLDLSFAERTHLLAEKGDGADQLVILEQRHDEQAARAGNVGERTDGANAVIWAWSAVRSGMWTTALVPARRASGISGCCLRRSITGSGRSRAAACSGAACIATMRNT